MFWNKDITRLYHLKYSLTLPMRRHRTHQWLSDRSASHITQKCLQWGKKSAYITLFNVPGIGNLPQTFVVQENHLGGDRIFHKVLRSGTSELFLLFLIVKHEAAPPRTPYRPWGISPGLNGNPTMVLGSGVLQTKRGNIGNTSQAAPSLGPTESPLQMALFI